MEKAMEAMKKDGCFATIGERATSDHAASQQQNTRRRAAAGDAQIRD
jgi:hypothetical protein